LQIAAIFDYSDEQQAIQFIKEASVRLQPVHVVLTETKISTVDGVSATRLIKKEYPDVTWTQPSSMSATSSIKCRRAAALMPPL
jgi:hypothetical protein